MDPEPGDPNAHVTRDDVAAAARQVGIVEGDTLIFHSSLSSMGTVEGGPDTVIDGFLDAVGPAGTVAVPTLCNWLPDEQALVFPRWDPATTPAYVGAIPEHFRHRPDAVRSDHATHSVAAIGARAVELTTDHGATGRRQCVFSDTAFAVASPWQRLIDWQAAYCFLGVNFRVATIVHLVECLLVEQALAQAPAERREALTSEVSGWLQPGVWPGYQIAAREGLEPILAERGLVHYAKLGSATLRCIRAHHLAGELQRQAAEQPEQCLSEAFRDWAQRCETGEPQ